jgi:D-threonate/D-erythronate kinase
VPFLVLADDLSGAADCAAAFADDVTRPVIHLGPRIAGPVVAPAAIDLDSRRMSEAGAVATLRSVLCAHFPGPAARLYKKIDSTLRGHVGAEIIATLEMIAARGDVAAGPLVVVAPSYPRLGRMMRQGRLVLRGDAADIAATGAIGDLPATLTRAGLAAAVVTVGEIRRGVDALRQRFAALGAAGTVAVVCDGETDDDLAIVARASLAMPGIALWVGSGGLAKALAAALNHGMSRPAFPAVSGPIVTLVGSATRVSRQQAAILAAMPDMVSYVVPADVLRNAEGPASRRLEGAVAETLAAGSDLVLTLPAPDGRNPEDRALASGLGRLIAPQRAAIGALVTTGGDTARSALEAFGTVRLRLAGEIEDGIVIATAIGDWHGAVVTKAGGFGDAEALSRVHAVLAARRSLRTRLVAVPHANL